MTDQAKVEQYLGRLRDPGLVRQLLAAIEHSSPGRQLRLMHVCGTHENALCQYGLRQLLPEWIKLVAGPGCPVCVCPAADLDMAGRLAQNQQVTMATFGDVVRVPARRSLMEVKAQGGDCRVVYGIDDAIRLAVENPQREVVFFAVGFETTACTTAAAVKRGLPKNFSVLCAHRIVPPALEALTGLEGEALDGFILPGHVTTVAGLGDYQALAKRCGVPMAVAGFEPVDLLLALQGLVERCLRKAGEKSAAPRHLVNDQQLVVNAYSRVVKQDGNRAARQAMAEVFEASDAAWRGIGVIKLSGLRLREQYAAHDAQRRFGVEPDAAIPDTHPGCLCGEVLLGRVEPEDCSLFGNVCNPDRPIGPCMVAFEGTCHARFRHGRRLASP